MKSPFVELNVKLKDLRNISGLTMQEVADSIGIKTGTYKHYEAGDSVPSLRSIRSLAKLYHIPLLTLLEDDTDELDRPTTQLNSAEFCNERAVKVIENMKQMNSWQIGMLEIASDRLRENQRIFPIDRFEIKIIKKEV